MTVTTVEKTCDVCGKKMQKDGPIWHGGYVMLEENYATADSFPHDKQTRDVCRECMKVVRHFLKLPQFDCAPLPQEWQDEVDKAIASMMREAATRRG